MPYPIYSYDVGTVQAPFAREETEAQRVSALPKVTFSQ